MSAAETPAVPTIAEALSAVMAEVGVIERGATMTQGQSYRYRKVDDILERLQPALIRHGVVVAPERIVNATYDLRTTKNGNPQQWVALVVEYRWTGPAGDSLLSMVASEAQDTSDKATNKAMTAAFKQALQQTLAIPFSGDDPDDYRADVGGPTDEQRRLAVDLDDRLDHLPADAGAKFVEWMKRNCDGAERVADAHPRHLPKLSELIGKAEAAAG